MQSPPAIDSQLKKFLDEFIEIYEDLNGKKITEPSDKQTPEIDGAFSMI